MKKRTSLEGQCFERKIIKSDFASFTTTPRPFSKGCMLSTEFFILILTIWIIIASTALVAGICFNLPPAFLASFKERFENFKNELTKKNKNADVAEVSTFLTESTQINRRILLE